MATFSLESHHFADAEDFARLQRELIAGHVPRISFDGAKRVVCLTLADGVVMSKPLGKALRRQILKVGTTTAGEAGLYLERAYTQNQALQPAMQKQHETLLQELAEAMRAQTGERILVVKSRNPGGAYSDGAGGIQNSDYHVAPSR